MKKMFAITILVILLVSSVFVYAPEDDRSPNMVDGQYEVHEMKGESKSDSRAYEKVVMQNHTEEDPFGGSWFDDFEDDSGIEGGLGGERLKVDKHTVGLWHFDEGSGNEAKDASGNGNDGTLLNMEEGDWVEGRFGKGLEFDGVDEYVEVKHSESLDINNIISLEAWIRTDSMCDNWETIILKHYNAGAVPYHCYGLWLNTEGKAAFVLGTTSCTFLYSSTRVNDGKWHYVTGSYDGLTMRIYIDGIEENWKTNSGNLKSHTSAVGIGALINGQTGTPLYYFNGIIDEARISNVSRTPEEIKHNYEGGLVLRNGKVEFVPKFDI